MIRPLLTGLVMITLAGVATAANDTPAAAPHATPAVSTPAPTSAPGALEASEFKDALHATRIAVQWLEKHQDATTGSWSQPSFPAITALAASAIMSAPDVRRAHAAGAPWPESVRRGLAFIAGCAQPDGGIYTPIAGVKGGGLPNYNTSLCLMALAEAGDAAYQPLIDKGRQWLIRSQCQAEGAFKGGMGYDPANQRPYADLSNTLMALEALRRTAPAERGEQPDLDWQAAIAFVSRCQHLRQSNAADWVRETPEERGGFVYHPEKSMAADPESIDGGNSMRSYGSMSYAGLLSFIYAEVDRDDARVQAAWQWLTRHWSLEENPNMGAKGLYYYLHTMAKALDAYGEDQVPTPDGPIAWRPALAARLVALQRIEPEGGLGYWQNDTNRWMENDPVLVTCYTLRGLSITIQGEARPRLNQKPSSEPR